MLIKDVMAAGPLSVRTDATIQQAAAGMRDAGVGALPVVNDTDKLAGIVTDRDIAVRATAEGLGSETPVERIMTRKLTVVEPSEELEDALSLMRENQLRRLPVVEGDRLVGMVAQADMASLAEEREAAATLRTVSEPAATQAEQRAKREQ